MQYYATIESYKNIDFRLKWSSAPLISELALEEKHYIANSEQGSWGQVKEYHVNKSCLIIFSQVFYLMWQKIINWISIFLDPLF